MFLRSDSGITRLELIGIVTIALLIAALSLPSFFKGYWASKRRIHLSMREHINTQIDLYTHFSGGRYPESMTEADWQLDSPSMTVSDFFPGGIPQLCPFGDSWQLDRETRKITLLGHEGHE